VNTHQDWTLKVATTELLNQPIPEDPPTRTVLDFIKNRSTSFSWAITEVTLDDNGIAIATALLQGTAILQSATASSRTIKARQHLLLKAIRKLDDW
jgi:hypothetical protein